LTGEQPDFGRLPLPPKLSPRSHRQGGRNPSTGRHWGRWLTIVAGALSVLVLGTSAVGYGYYRKLDSNIHRVKVFNFAPSEQRPAKAKDGAMNILLVGSDSRDGATAAQLREALTTADGGGLNTDTIILMHISAENVVTMVSFPRDSWVKIPGHGEFKINSAFADGESDHKGGGPALLTQTVENLSGVHIDHFVQVGFFQFMDITRAIGGVRVCIESPDGKGAHEPKSGIDLPEGPSIVSGSQALAFVRQRYDLPNGDFDRINRQRRFLAAVVKQVRTIRDPGTVNTLLAKVTSSLTVDEGLSGQGLIKLGDRLRDIDLSAIQFQTPPVISNPPPKRLNNGQFVSYIQLDTKALPAFFQNVVKDVPNATTSGATSGAPTVSPTTTPSVAPSDVNVEVRNGRGTANSASTAKTKLIGYGFTVTNIGDTTRTSTTIIRHAIAQQAAADLLAKAVPGAELVLDDTLGSTITLVLGKDALPIVNPKSGGSAPTASPTSSSSGSVTPVITADTLDCGP
jgi:LCP family protein required for cell wall assembly